MCRAASPASSRCKAKRNANPKHQGLVAAEKRQSSLCCFVFKYEYKSPICVGHRNCAKQKLPAIEYGLLTDRDGYPVSVQVYPGDTGAPKTVPDQPGKLKA